ncbi:ABC transporter ATP-binding protein [Paenibacillus doosanensis]|uniref:ABC transporter ATP-binding protein n=1 Tax=Paenibacillus doosanensis TaxID=1229154 RepID=UPI00217FE7D4|nr:ABC transporter ATP-binding protein [Paenibacillus doosanensis]
MTNAFGWLAIFIGILFLHSIFEMINQWYGSNLREHIKVKAQEQLLHKASRLSLEHFETPATYDQLRRAQQGVEQSLSGTLEHLFYLFLHFFTAAGLLIYIGSTHVIFPPILITGVIVLQYVQIRFNRQKYLLDQKHTPSERRLQYLSRLLVERQSAAEIRVFGLQNYLFNKREELFHKLRDDRLELAAHGFRLRIFPSILEQFMYVLVLTGVVAFVAIGKLSLGHYAAFIGAAERFRDSTMLSFGSLITLDHDLRYIGDMLDYLQIQEKSFSGNVTKLNDEGINSSKENHIPTIRFESVTFQYSGFSKPILDGVSFTIHPGERIALVGLNGAGKSTLAKLLLGLYRPTSGRITIDGQDLSDVDPALWRVQTAAVFQDYMKYQLTVRENIGFGNLEMMNNEKMIHDAAVKGGVDQVIQSLPAMYNTLLGKEFDEQGEDLSIGQWQKLAISRAYIKNASVLVLDEPTSALDAKAEVDVYNHFQNMAENKSVLFISHRLGYAKLTDRIFVLDSGKIVEEGSHDELISINGNYAQLYEIQSQWYK